MKWMLRTRNSLSALILRLALGAVMFPHGAQKALGLFGGKGLKETVAGMSGAFGLSPTLVYLVIAGEFLGAIGLVLGFLGRLAALGILAVMAGAVYLAHYQHGFFMNWYGNQQGEGFEYHILAGAMALALVFLGSGALSVDRALTRDRP